MTIVSGFIQFNVAFVRFELIFIRKVCQNVSFRGLAKFMSGVTRISAQAVSMLGKSPTKLKMQILSLSVRARITWWQSHVPAPPAAANAARGWLQSLQRWPDDDVDTGKCWNS